MMGTVMATAVLLIGCVETWQLSLLAALSTVALIVTVFSDEPFVPRQEAVLLFGVGVGLVAFTALQAVPLPARVVSFLSPHAADVWARCLHPLAKPGPAWHSLSLDPQATRVEALKGLVYLQSFVATLIVARHHGGVQFLERVIVALVVVVALAAIVHDFVGAHKVWGLYTPRTSVSSIAPLMNTNQLAGFVNVGLLLAAASTISETPRIPRSVAAVVVVGLGGVEIWLASRGAVGAGIVGLLLVASSSFRSQTARRRFLPTALVIGITLAGIAMLVIAKHDYSIEGIRQRDVSKLGVMRVALTTMLPQYWLFGSGRGAFESTFPEFRLTPGYMVFTHPENWVVEWITGWGAPVALVAAVLIVYALRPRSVFVRSRPPIGAYAALVALALQNLVDFSSETPGVMVNAAVCAAIIVSGARVSTKKVTAPPFRPVAIVLSIAGALSILLAYGGRSHELLTEKEALAQMLHQDARATDVIQAAEQAAQRHPAEPYVPYAAAVAASTDATGSVVAWCGRTLERAPVYGPAHLTLARWFRKRSPAQSRLEYHLAQEQGMPYAVTFREVESLVTGPREAIDLALSGADGIPLLDAASVGVAQRLPATSATIDAEILRRQASHANALVRRAKAAWLDSQSDAASWCTAQECWTLAYNAAAMAEQVAPTLCDGYLITANLLIDGGRVPDGLKHVHSHLTNVTEWAACDMSFARLAIASRREVDASEAIEELARHACSANACVDNLLGAAELELLRKSPHRALIYLRRAEMLAPERDDVIATHARAASELGLHAEAAEAYQKLHDRHPADPTYALGLRAEAAASGRP
jgi:hypothetical protein